MDTVAMESILLDTWQEVKYNFGNIDHKVITELI